MPKVTQKGQVTIPYHIRSLLGITTGDEIIFKVAAGKIFLKKKQAATQNRKKYIGFLSHLKEKKPDDIIDELRGKPDDPDN